MAVSVTTAIEGLGSVRRAVRSLLAGLLACGAGCSSVPAERLEPGAERFRPIPGSSRTIWECPTRPIR